jgi:transketolase
MRNTLERLITNWMRQDEKVIFLAADIGGGLYKNIKAKYADRTINVGIAEQNMVGMAAGLAQQGFRVICYSKACFISLRVLDQIKNALCYAKLPVILIAADAGYDEANAGAPHTALEDLGAINSLADICIYTPTTTKGLESIFYKVMESDKPSYIRINKECISNDTVTDCEMTEGFYYILKGGTDKKILNIVNGCVARWTIQEAEGDIMAVDDWQSLSENFIQLLKSYDEVIVWEEQFTDNGLYAKLCILMVENKLTEIDLKRIGPEKTYRRVCFYREDAELEEKMIYTGGI